jgi:hypothetical protein
MFTRFPRMARGTSDTRSVSTDDQNPLGFPAKLSARSDGKPKALCDDPDHHRSVATLATRSCLQVFGLRHLLSARTFASHEMKDPTELPVGVSSAGFKFDCGRRRHLLCIAWV